MPENIRDHGGVEGDSSEGACETNVQAITDAAIADGNNEVYLPEGEWFIGSARTHNGDALRPGCGDADNRGPAGLSFVGDGPDKSFLRWGSLSAGDNNRIRYCDGDHGTVTWTDLTYDGRWRHFRDQGHDFASGNQWGIRTGDVASEFLFENVRITGMGGNAVFTGFGHDALFRFNRCSFYDNGFGIHQAKNGDRHQHHIAAWCDSNATVEVTNCHFRLCSGTVINTNGPANGDGIIRVENVYAEGFGSSFHKFDDPGTVIDRNVHINAVTDELLQNYVNDVSAAYFYRFTGDTGFAPTTVIDNVKVVNAPGYGFRVADGNDMVLQGGDVRMENVATHPGRDEALSGHDGSFTFDNFGDISVHGTAGAVARLGASDGSIATLNWADADEGFGNAGGVDINANEGGPRIEVAVPAPSDVGVSTTTTPPDDGGDQPDETELSVSNGGGETEYHFVVDGEITRTESFEAEETISDDRTAVSGFVRGGADTFFYTGCVQSFSWSGVEPTITRNGSAVPLNEVVQCPPTRQPQGGLAGLAIGLGAGWAAKKMLE